MEKTVRAAAVEEVARQLGEAQRRSYLDLTGEGTLYTVSGARHGVPFCRGLVEVGEDGLVTVSVRTGQRVGEGLAPALAKLARVYSTRFRLRGLEVDNGELVFRTEPFAPTGGRFGVDEAVSLAFSTVHSYAGLVLALDAGVEPWELVDYDGEDPATGCDDGEGDDGGPAGESLVRMLLEAMEDARAGVDDGNGARR